MCRFAAARRHCKPCWRGILDVAAADIMPFRAHIATGKLRALGQAGRKRRQSLPAVPNMAEQGQEDFEVIGWFGLYAPAVMAPANIAQLNAEVARLPALQEGRERFLALGLRAASSTPDALTARGREDVDEWNRVIKAAGAARLRRNRVCKTTSRNRASHVAPPCEQGVET